VALYGLATHLTWRLVHVGTGRKFILALGRAWIGRWICQALRLLYYMGIPFAVLWRGALFSEMGIPTTYVEHMGDDVVLGLLSLAGIADIAHLGTWALTAGGALCLLIAIWVWYARTMPSLDYPIPEIPWWRALREALFLQALWAFYRAFASTLTLEPVHIAFVSLALVTLSWLISPRRRHDLFTSRGYAVARDWMFALFTACITLVGNSLYVLILMHALWLWTSDRVLRHFAPVATSPIGQSHPKLP
jgi:hypothetical protein